MWWAPFGLLYSGMWLSTNFWSNLFAMDFDFLQRICRFLSTVIWTDRLFPIRAKFTMKLFCWECREIFRLSHTSFQLSLVRASFFNKWFKLFYLFYYLPLYFVRHKSYPLFEIVNVNKFFYYWTMDDDSAFDGITVLQPIPG